MGTYVPVPFYGNDNLTYPVASAGITLTAGAANVYGASADLVVTADIVAGGMTGDVVLESVTLRTPSAGQVGKLRIGHQTGGGAENWICEVDFECATDAGFTPRIDLLGRGGLIPAGADIIAGVKTVAGGTTITASVGIMSAV